MQSIAFAYLPGGEPHLETDPLNLDDPARAVTVRGAADMERQSLDAGMEAIVLRYGLLYGPGTWSEGPARKPALHVDAAAQAAAQALTHGAPGIYNIADDDGAVSIAKARAELGFDPRDSVLEPTPIAPAQGRRSNPDFKTDLCHSTINFDALHGSVLALRCGNVHGSRSVRVSP